MPIKNYSTTAASNNSAPPNGAPENMLPSTVNNVIRQNMADTRSWYEDAEWRDFGDTATYVSGTSFTVSTDLTARYVANRRIRAVGTTTGTIYGTIASSSYSAPDTTVTVTWDSGSLVSETLAISLGVTPTNKSIPGSSISGEIPQASVPAFRGARLTLSGSLDIGSLTGGLITWDTEQYDTDGFHETATNPGFFTIPAGVSYVRLTCLVVVQPNSVTTGYIQAILGKDTNYDLVGTEALARAVNEYNNMSAPIPLLLDTGVIPVSEGNTFPVTLNDNLDGSPDIGLESFFAIEVIE